MSRHAPRSRCPSARFSTRRHLIELLEKRTFLSSVFSPPIAPTILSAHIVQAIPGVPASRATSVIWTDNSNNESGFHLDIYNVPPDTAGATPIDSTTLGPNYTQALLKPGSFAVLSAFNADGLSPVQVAPVDVGSWTISGLSGSAIGTPGSWNNSGNDLTKAFDNDIVSFFDAPTPQAWVGYDLGKPASLSYFSFVPRSGFADRMIGGSFQGSNDASTWTTLGTITSSPAEGVYTALGSTSLQDFRYVRYLSPENGWGNIASLRFYGAPASFLFPAAPTNFHAQANGVHIALSWTDNATNEDRYTLNVFSGSSQLTSMTLPANSTSATFDAPGPGSYNFVLRASNSTGSSPTVTTSDTVPTPPSNFAASLASAGGVQLVWTDTTHVNNLFSIYRKVDSGSFSVLTTVGPTINSYVDSTATAAGSTYSYYLTATVTPDISPPTPIASVTIPTPTTDVLLTGTGFGTAGSWNNSGNTFTKALDGNVNTFFDSPQASGSVVGLDVGTPAVVSSVRFYPRPGFTWRMPGGKFQGSSDQSTWTDLAAISTQPSDGQYTTLAVTNPAGFRYFRYLSPADSFGNVAEIEFYGHHVTGPLVPATPTGVTASQSSQGLTFVWPGVANAKGFYADLSSNPAFPTDNTYHATTTYGTGGNYTFPASSLSPGLYYFRLTAYNDFGNSAPYLSGPVAYSAPQVTQLVGTGVGTPGSWNNTGNDFTKALDGNPNTFFDAPVPTAYVGYDYGSSPVALSYIKIAPRPDVAWRIPGGSIEGSNDGSSWDQLLSFSSGLNLPNGVLTQIMVNDALPYRYLRYLSPYQGYGNIGEIQFFGTRASIPSLFSGTPIGTPGSWNNTGNDLTKAFDNNLSTFFDAPTSQASVGLHLASPATLALVRLAPRPGFEYRMPGGTLQGSSDGSSWTTLSTLTSTPAAGTFTSIPINSSTPFSFFRYLSPPDGWGNIAELQFYGT